MFDTDDSLERRLVPPLTVGSIDEAEVLDTSIGSERLESEETGNPVPEVASRETNRRYVTPLALSPPAEEDQESELDPKSFGRSGKFFWPDTSVPAFVLTSVISDGVRSFRQFH